MSRPTPRSFLTYRAVKRAPVADGDAFDDVGATPALLAVAVIDAQMVLKFAALVIGVAVVRKRRAAPADGVAQQLGGRGGDGSDLPARQPPSARRRPDARAEQNFIGINIPQTRDYLLVQQQVP